MSAWEDSWGSSGTGNSVNYITPIQVITKQDDNILHKVQDQHNYNVILENNNIRVTVEEID